MTTTVLVTGARGYLGGRIAQTLARSGRFAVRLGLRHPGPGEGSADTAMIDLASPPSLMAACRGVDAIVHLAAVNEIVSGNDPERALEINGAGTLRLLRAAVATHVPRFLYFSTAHVYGPLVGTIDETRVPRPSHPYAISHKVAEDFVLAAHDRGELTGLVVRLSNGIGAPADARVDRWSLVGNDLCRQAVVDRHLVLKSAGLQERDFITLEDTARAVLHLLTLERSACGDGLFNLGGECPLSIMTLASRIAGRAQAVLGFTPPLMRPESNKDALPAPLRYRIDKLKSTGFALTGVLDEEIDRTLQLCDQAFGGLSRV